MLRYCFLFLLLLASACRHEAAVLGTSKAHLVPGAIIGMEANDANSKSSQREVEWKHFRRKHKTMRELQEPWPDVFFSTELVNEKGKPAVAKPAPSATQAPTILQPLEHMEKSPIDHRTHAVSQQDDAEFLIFFDLSIAVVRSDEASENAVNIDTLTAISSVLDTVIETDTSYELLRKNASPSNVADRTNWKYALKQENATTTHLLNRKCRLIDSNETIMVTWLQTRLEYTVLPWWNDNDNLYDLFSYEVDEGSEDSNSDEYEDEDEDEDEEEFDFDALGSYVENMKTAYGEWKSKKISCKVMNAAIARIHNGSLLKWIQQQASGVVGVVQVGDEELARCVAVDDENLDGPIPFVDPMDMRSWDSLQIFGCILFIVTFLGTSTLCLVGHSRSKRAEEWSAVMGDESAVNAFLNLSAQFLPPECLNQREEGAATLVTMPANA